MNGGPAIVLCGFMGSGKSTVGRRVARSLERDFTDADDVVEERLGKTISEVFASGAEAHFRDVEAGVVVELVRARPAGVVSLGGGALERPETLEVVLGESTVVYLDRPLTAILAMLERLRQQRPLLADRSAAEIEELYARRRATYLQCPVRIEVGDLGVDQVAAEVVAALARGRHLLTAH